MEFMIRDKNSWCILHLVLNFYIFFIVLNLFLEDIGNIFLVEFLLIILQNLARWKQSIPVDKQMKQIKQKLFILYSLHTEIQGKWCS